jgi:hypothetical protein
MVFALLVRLKPMAKSACFWFIGVDNANQLPAVAVDLHGDHGELIAETMTKEIASIAEGRRFARAYAAKHGISNLVYDNDSTQFHRKD